MSLMTKRQGKDKIANPEPALFCLPSHFCQIDAWAASISCFWYAGSFGSFVSLCHHSAGVLLPWFAGVHAGCHHNGDIGPLNWHTTTTLAMNAANHAGRVKSL